MKQFIIAVAMLAFSGTAVFAQSENAAKLVPSDATLKAQKTEMLTLTNKLENEVKAKKTDQVEASSYKLLNMMRNHVADTRYMAEAKGGPEGKVIMKRMLMLEQRVAAYMNIRQDAMKNGNELVSQARTFANDY
ncbi:MAG: hypothetical protein ABI378_11345 [Chitinophagaceae bacterium]